MSLDLIAQYVGYVFIGLVVITALLASIYIVFRGIKKEMKYMLGYYIFAVRKDRFNSWVKQKSNLTPPAKK